eukprot:867085-Pyramimonas_sp.AAC.1
MRQPHPLRHVPHTFRCTVGSSTEGPSATARMRQPHPLRHTPSHAWWPHRQPHRRPQCNRLHASGAPAKAPMPPPACASHTHFGTPLTRFVAP